MASASPATEAGQAAEGARAVATGPTFTAVDGLRGIAVLALLVASTGLLPSGPVAVDVFLVTCGFLVTVELLREAAGTGRVAVGRFYRRRAKAVLPPLAITLGVTLAFSYLLGDLREARRVGGQALAGLLQVANWHQLSRDEAHWDPLGRIDPLSHLWALGILEQVLLLWPVVLAVLCWLFRGAIAPVVLAVLAGAAAAATVAPMTYDGRNGRLLELATHSRGLGVLAGAGGAGVVFLACRRRRRGEAGLPGSSQGRDRPRLAVLVTALVGTLCAAALAVLVAAVVLTAGEDEPWRQRGGLAAVAGAATLLATLLCRERGPVFRLFSWPPLVDFGRMSYTVYLLHLPVYWLLTKVQPDVSRVALLCLGGGLTWFLSLIVHYGVSQRLGGRPWRGWPATTVLALTVAVLAAGASYLPHAVARRTNPEGKPVVLVLGDPLAQDLADALAERDGRRYAVDDGDLPACGVMVADRSRTRTGQHLPTGDCRDWERGWRISIRTSEPDVIVARLGWDAAEQWADDRWLSPCHPAYQARYRAQLERAARVWAGEAPRVPVLLLNERTQTTLTDTAGARCYNSLVDVFAAATPEVWLLDLDGFLCPGARCRRETPDRQPLYADGVRLSRAGREYVAGWLEAAIADSVG